MALLPWLGGCGAGSLLDSTSPWIRASWASTAGQNLSKSSLGTLRVAAGAYGGAKATAVLEMDRLAEYTPRTLALDDFGTGQTTLVASGVACASGTAGAVIDSLTARLVVAGTTKATARLAVACQDALR